MNTDDTKRIGNDTAGFTIIEMIAVLIILAVVAVVAVTRYTSTTQYNVTTETEILKTNLRYAQFRAISDADTTYGSKNSTWGVSLYSGSYELQHKYNGVTANTYNFPEENSPTHVLPSGISITSGAGSNITYSVWGIPIDTSGANLTANVAITLSDGSSSQTVTVVQRTGFIQ